MTARLETARTGIHNVVQMYMPMHQSFTEEGTRQLNKAIAELEAAAVDAAKGLKPATPAVPTGPAPDLVKLNEPAAGVDDIEPPTAPMPAPLPVPSAEIAASKAVTDPKPAKAKKAK